MRNAARETEFTGRHMLAIMVAFFGVIIAVNLTMAVLARTSWTGLVVENTYVASQQFNAKMAETRAQAALGWTSTLTFAEGRARYALRDKRDHPVAMKSVAMTFKHPVDDREDEHVVLVRDPDGSFHSEAALPDGVWLVEVEAEAGLATPYRETLRVHLAGGKRS